MTLIEFLQQGWVIIAAIIGGVTLVWNFGNKTLREIVNTLSKPLKDLEDKVDKLSKKVDESNKSDVLTKEALLSLQRQSLLDSCETYLKRGFATLEQKETIDKQFESYKALGGNHFVENMVDNVNSLPLTKTVKPKKK